MAVGEPESDTREPVGDTHEGALGRWWLPGWFFFAFSFRRSEGTAITSQGFIRKLFALSISLASHSSLQMHSELTGAWGSDRR